MIEKITSIKEYIYNMEDINELIMDDLTKREKVHPYSEFIVVRDFHLPLDDSKIIMKEIKKIER